MGKINIAIIVNEGGTNTKFSSKKPTSSEIGLAISKLELIKLKLLQNFAKHAKIKMMKL